MKKISIIVPFKNTPLRWFLKLLDSLNSQTNKNFEAIFIDDNSDNGIDYKEWINKYKFKYVKNKTVQGVGKLRDLGVKLSKNDYVWFVDSDDWITEDAVDYLLNSFYKYHEIDLIMFDYHWVYDYKKDSFKKTDNDYKEYVSNNIISKENMKWFHNNYQTDWRVCFKKEFLVKNEIFHKDKDNIFEDVYFGLVWKVLFKKILLTSKKIYYYNRLNLSSTLNNYKYQSEFLLNTILTNKKYLIKRNIFNDIWYFYVINWSYTLFQLKKKNMYGLEFKNAKNQFLKTRPKIHNIKNIGLNKYWFRCNMLWMKPNK